MDVAWVCGATSQRLQCMMGVLVSGANIVLFVDQTDVLGVQSDSKDLLEIR